MPVGGQKLLRHGARLTVYDLPLVCAGLWQDARVGAGGPGHCARHVQAGELEDLRWAVRKVA